MQSISFQLRSGEHPYNVDYEKFDISVLHSINRILDSECYEGMLIIEVDIDQYKEIGEWLANNHWALNFANHIDSDGYNIVLDRHELIIKKK